MVVVVGAAVVVVVVVLVDVVVVGAVVVVVGAAVVVVVVGAGATVDVDVDATGSAMGLGRCAAASAGLCAGSWFRSPASLDGSFTADASGADTTERASASGTVVDVSAATIESATPFERPLVDISDPPAPLHADAIEAASTATRSVRRETARVDGAGIATKHRRLATIS